MSDTQVAIDEHTTTDGVLKNFELLPKEHVDPATNEELEHSPFSLRVPGAPSLRQRPESAPYKTNLD